MGFENRVKLLDDFEKFDSFSMDESSRSSKGNDCRLGRLRQDKRWEIRRKKLVDLVV